MSDDPILGAIKALRVDFSTRLDRLQDSLVEIHGDIAVSVGARVEPRAILVGVASKVGAIG
jgi:hypothetical protein